MAIETVKFYFIYLNPAFSSVIIHSTSSFPTGWSYLITSKLRFVFLIKMGLLWVIFVSLILGIIALLRFLAVQDANYFKNKGIYYLGNSTYRMLKLTLMGKMSLVNNTIDQYKEVKLSANRKVAGTMDFGTTSLWVQDPELIKHILIKDFDHFVDRRQFNFPKEEMFGKMLFAKKGDQWKSLRSKLSPTFTTGKIKRMFQIMNQSGKRFVTFLEQELSLSEGGEIEIGDAYSKLTMDVVAAAAIGIDSKAFESREPSIFEQMGNKLRFQFGGFQLIRFLIITMLPKVAEIFGMTFFGLDVQEFFAKAVKGTIQHREKTGEKRDDFIQLMLEARANQLKTEESELNQFEKDAMIKTDTGSGSVQLELDDDIVVANCVLFIVGGFDTTQSLMLFATYSLALNPEVQEKLRAEVDSALEESDGELTYDGLNKIEYLDMVINGELNLVYAMLFF
jgi:cytochrome P450